MAYRRYVVRFVLGVFYIMLFVTNCEDSASPKEKYCDRLSISNGQPVFDFQCNSIAGSAQYEYDDYGRYMTITLDYKCTDTGKSYKIKFYNIARNMYGSAVSFDATINGEKCHYQ